jgi:8-oxo-dGTP pyrophosphatase MutT (NUDIX family)
MIAERLKRASEFLGDDPGKYGQFLNIGPRIDIIYRRRRADNDPAKVNKFWSGHLRDRPKDFDGCIASVKRITRAPGRALIETRWSHFAAYAFSREARQGRKIDLDDPVIDRCYPMPLTIGAIAITSDGRVVAARRGKTAYESDQVAFVPGGYFNPQNDCVGSALSIEKLLMRESQEELKIDLIDIMRWKTMGMVQSLSGSCQPMIALMIDLAVTESELRKRFSADEEEIRELIFVDADKESLRELYWSRDLCPHDRYKVFLYIAETAYS